MREARAGLEHALDIVDRVAKQSVALDPAAHALGVHHGPGEHARRRRRRLGLDADERLPRRARHRLPGGQARSTRTRTPSQPPDRSRRTPPSTPPSTSSDGFDASRRPLRRPPDATLSPESLAGTASAKELKKEAEDTFNALPDQFGALAAVFAPRPDDIYIPTTLTGEDGEKVQDAIDAFVTEDHTATRFYLTSSNAPYTATRSRDQGRPGRARGRGRRRSAPRRPATSAAPRPSSRTSRTRSRSDFLKVGAITVLGILLVLMLLLRAVVAPLYLVGDGARLLRLHAGPVAPSCSRRSSGTRASARTCR